ncbi:MAG: phage antirepressor KilAC domain-containing protein [Alphaproteobacteria bacterium]
MKKNKKALEGFVGSLFPDFENEPNIPVKAKKETLKQQLNSANAEIIRLQQENKHLQEENSRLSTDVENLRSKAEVYDSLMGTKGNCFTTTVVAKMLGVSSAEKLNEYLASKRIQYKTSDDCWVLYADYAEKKYVMFRWFEYGTQSRYQKSMSKPHMYWTLKGIEFIRSLYKKDGLL